MDTNDDREIRQLFDDYLRMYASRDDNLTTYFSADFSGFTGGGDFLVKEQEKWVAITRQDFAQVKDPLRIELKDLAIQSLSETIAVTTGFFHIHLPIEDLILSRETARLVLIFRKESTGWKITHSSISIPYHLVREGEVYPLNELEARNKLLEEQIAERTVQLSELNDNLHQANEKLAREIEERKLAEENLRQAKTAAEAANIAKSQFLATMSHEIRTPLNALVGFSSLARTATDPEKLAQYFTILEQSSRSLMALVNDVLDMSKIEAGRMEFEAVPFNLRQLVCGLEEQYRLLAEQKKLSLRIAIAAEVPVGVLGDPLRLSQILANLLANAVKFTENGEVSCSVSRIARPDGDGYPLMRFEIQDTGIGIPESGRDLLFEPFRQLDPTITRKFGGTGLGLAIVHSLVTMMKGSLAVSSREGSGSCFVVEIPFKELESLPDDSAAPVALPSGRVLVVEDNEFNRRLLEELLVSLGQQVLLAENGSQALQLMESHRFDLVLLDIRMPGMDGIEVATRMRRLENERSQSPVPVIAITADVDAATRKACFDAGINEVLAKPLNPEHLARAIGAFRSAAVAEISAEELQLNPQTLKGLGSNPERAIRYRNMLQEDIEHELQRLQDALGRDERTEFGRSAHTLKGLCGHLASREPAEQAEWLQHNGAAPQEQIRQVIEQIRASCKNRPLQENNP